MKGVIFSAANKYHAREMGRTMRIEDRAEILASGNWSDAEKCVRANINRALESWAVYVGDDLLAVFGVTAGRDGWAVPWAFTSTYVAKHPKQFWQISVAMAESLRRKHPYMVQMVHARYEAARRWLARLGFVLEPPLPFGARGEMFCRATCVTREVVCATH